MTTRLANKAIRLLDKFPERPITFHNRLKALVGEDPNNTKITECLEKCLQYVFLKCERALPDGIEKDTVELFNTLYKNAFLLILREALEAHVAKMHPGPIGSSALDPNELPLIDYFAEFRKEDSSFYFVIVLNIFQIIANLYQRYKFHTLAPNDVPIFRISPDMVVYKKARALIERGSDKKIILERGETIEIVTPIELLIHALCYRVLENLKKAPEQNLEREIYIKFRGLMDAICKTYIFRKNTWEQIADDYQEELNKRLMFGIPAQLVLERMNAIRAFEEHFTTFPIEFGTKSIQLAFEVEYLHCAPYYFARLEDKVYLLIVVFDQTGVCIGSTDSVGLPAVSDQTIDMQQIISANFKKKRFRQTMRQIISDNTTNSGSEDAMHEIDILDHILFIIVNF